MPYASPISPAPVTVIAGLPSAAVLRIANDSADRSGVEETFSVRSSSSSFRSRAAVSRRNGMPRRSKVSSRTRSAWPEGVEGCARRHQADLLLGAENGGQSKG